MVILYFALNRLGFKQEVRHFSSTCLVLEQFFDRKKYITLFQVQYHCVFFDTIVRHTASNLTWLFSTLSKPFSTSCNLTELNRHLTQRNPSHQDLTDPTHCSTCSIVYSFVSLKHDLTPAYTFHLEKPSILVFPASNVRSSRHFLCAFRSPSIRFTRGNVSERDAFSVSLKHHDQEFHCRRKQSVKLSPI